MSINARYAAASLGSRAVRAAVNSGNYLGVSKVAYSVFTETLPFRRPARARLKLILNCAAIKLTLHGHSSSTSATAAPLLHGT